MIPICLSIYLRSANGSSWGSSPLSPSSVHSRPRCLLPESHSWTRIFTTPMQLSVLLQLAFLSWALQSAPVFVTIIGDLWSPASPEVRQHSLLCLANRLCPGSKHWYTYCVPLPCRCGRLWLFDDRSGCHLRPFSPRSAGYSDLYRWLRPPPRTCCWPDLRWVYC